MTDADKQILIDLAARYRKSGEKSKAVSIQYAIVLLLKEKNRAIKATKREIERNWAANQPQQLGAMQ